MNSSDFRRNNVEGQPKGLWILRGLSALMLTPAAAAILKIDGITEPTKVTKTKVHKQVMALWGDGPGAKIETGLTIIESTVDGKKIATVDVEVPAAQTEEVAPVAEIETPEVPVDEPVAEVEIAEAA